MSDIPNSSAKIQIEGAEFRRPVSEALVQAVGGAVNYLLNEDANVTQPTLSTHTSQIAAIQVVDNVQNSNISALQTTTTTLTNNNRLFSQSLGPFTGSNSITITNDSQSVYVLQVQFFTSGLGFGPGGSPLIQLDGKNVVPALIAVNGSGIGANDVWIPLIIYPGITTCFIEAQSSHPVTILVNGVVIHGFF